MYFQTGQVIFVPEWPKGEFVSILALFCVWTKSLMYKDVVNRDSTCQSIFRRLCTAKKIEDFSFPDSRPDDMSSRPDAHLSTVPSLRKTCSSRPDARQTKIIRPDDVSFPSGPLHCIEKLLFQLASVRTSQQPVRMPLSTRTVSDSFQVPINGRSINRPDDVVSRLDARLLKARIPIQMSPSGRQSALAWTRAHQLRKLPIRLQPSGRLPLLVRTHA